MQPSPATYSKAHLNTRLTTEQFGSLFDCFEREAFRLELRDHYSVDTEREEFARYLRGEPLSEHQNRGWCEYVRSMVQQGKKVSRVHIMSMPLTPYLRFEIDWGYVFSSTAGEEIFLLPRPKLTDVSILRFGDFWLFDKEQLVRMDYTGEGAFRHAEFDNDPDSLQRARSIRERLMVEAIPLRQYLAQQRSS